VVSSSDLLLHPSAVLCCGPGLIGRCVWHRRARGRRGQVDPAWIFFLSPPPALPRTSVTPQAESTDLRGFSPRVVCSYVRYVNAGVWDCHAGAEADRMIEKQPEPARFDILARYPVMICGEEANKDEDAEVTFTTTESESRGDRGEDSDASEVYTHPHTHTTHDNCAMTHAQVRYLGP
jgi:hypothetical protein